MGGGLHALRASLVHRHGYHERIMIAIEISGRIDHGQITLSQPPPADWEGRSVRAIIMADEAPVPPRPLPPSLHAPGFVPLRRDELYDRT